MARLDGLAVARVLKAQGRENLMDDAGHCSAAVSVERS